MALVYTKAMTDNAFAHAVLPKQYYFIDKTIIQPTEIVALRESVNWKGDTIDRWQVYIRQSLTIVGVCNAQSHLVGMACIAGNIRHAVLCDLVVHPKHQNKGIGAAIMSALLKATDGLDISYLYAELAETNPFRNHMMRSGFKATGNSLFKVYSS